MTPIRPSYSSSPSSSFSLAGNYHYYYFYLYVKILGQARFDGFAEYDRGTEAGIGRQ